jgi:pimeloyl-ACP methyl ester carboxylesterase
MRISAFFLLLLAVALLISACTTMRPVTAPVDTRWYRQDGTPNRTLLVLLPGRRDSIGTFEEEGFIRLIQNADIPADMVAVDAHLGYYHAQQVVPRLREDVILPALATGYENIWLVGLSLGGFGALWYDRDYPSDIKGLVLLAPFLGYHEIIDEVSAAGGVRTWTPGEAWNDDYQRKIWRMVKGYEPPSRSAERVYLCYGLNDSFARPDGMFAAILPPAQVLTAEGGHDWSTWRNLLSTLLTRPEFLRAIK